MSLEQLKNFCEFEKQHSEKTHIAQWALAEIERLKGEAAVLRGLLCEALGVIETIDDEESDEWEMLTALKTKIEAAIVGVTAS